jgi:hypothetical protein
MHASLVPISIAKALAFVASLSSSRHCYVCHGSLWLEIEDVTYKACAHAFCGRCLHDWIFGDPEGVKNVCPANGCGRVFFSLDEVPIKEGVGAVKVEEQNERDEVESEFSSSLIQVLGQSLCPHRRPAIHGRRANRCPL